MMRHAFLILAVLALKLTSPAQAMEFIALPLNSPSYIEAKGDVKTGDAARLEQLIKRYPQLQTVRLQSPGGLLYEGFKLGETIRKAKLGTEVSAGSTCASACVFIFAGGVIRDAAPSARIVVHMASAYRNERYIAALKKILLMSDVSLDARIRYITLLNEQNSATAMTEQAAYLQKMGVSLKLLSEIAETSHLDGNKLSVSKLRELNLVNIN